RSGQPAANLRITNQVAHNPVDVHNAPKGHGQLSTIHSQPDTLATLGRHWVIPNLHSP
ncbi:MAG: hypothetical protein QOF67_3875, partial [Mycobacterium sp.]|nr:hypothetical protein [Mycobacterium sp.]